MTPLTFISAHGIVPIKLEQADMGLQLACVGSKSTINYGGQRAHNVRNPHVEEYFAIAHNYDASLCFSLMTLNVYPGLD